jgi:hypothetical protein
MNRLLTLCCHRLSTPALFPALTGMLFLWSAAVSAYPIDGYDKTGIRRLARAEQILAGKIKGPAVPAGATLGTDNISLNLLSVPLDLSTLDKRVDQNLQDRISALFPNRDESYSIAILDITPGRPIRMAEQQSLRRFPVGSVGKLAIAAGLFAELKALFPSDPDRRQALLKNRIVVAGPWIETDHHTLPVFNPDTGAFVSREAIQGDSFSLYEWADHMISASANSAASTLWKELVLMRHFKHAYPPDLETEKNFFSTTPKKILSELAAAVVDQPLLDAGISREEFHLGNLFTVQGKKMIPGTGDSQASPLGLLKFLAALEQGRIVDPWSSLEIKRLMYSTARRIRYASSPSLAGAAVYFKSGSLYKCIPEPGFSCKKYMGNKENVMNSVVIVEHSGSQVYLVALMTNVLKKNSAVDHQTLATEIDRIIRN